MMRHLLVRRSSGFRCQWQWTRHRTGFRRSTHRRASHDAGIGFPVDVRRRRTADFGLRPGGRGVVGGGRGGRRMRVGVGALRPVLDAGLGAGPAQVAGLRGRRVRLVRVLSVW